MARIANPHVRVYNSANISVNSSSLTPLPFDSERWDKPNDDQHTLITRTGNTHSTTTIDNLAQTSDLNVGMMVSGSGIPAGATITAINSASSITISSAATTTVTGNSLTFAPTRLFCQLAGLYVITGNVDWAAAATGVRSLFIRVNGATYVADDQRANAGASDAVRNNVTAQYRLAVGDYVELIAWHNQGSAMNVFATAQYSLEFAMAWLSG